MSQRKRKFGSTVPHEGTSPMVLEIYDREFKVRGEMPGLRILRIIDAMESSEEDGVDVGMLVSFIRDAFLASDREEGMAALEDPDKVVPFTMLIEIVQWLVGEYTGNPTEQQPQSETSSETTGLSSSESAPSTGSTSAVLTESNSGPLEQPTPAEQS